MLAKEQLVTIIGDDIQARVNKILKPYKDYTAAGAKREVIIRIDELKHKRGEVSIYLDCYGCLSSWTEPHWEVYPNKDGDPERFEMKDTEGLLQCVTESFESQNKQRESTYKLT